MLAILIRFCLRQKLLVLALMALVAAAGIYSALRLPIDAVPDITNKQVQINASAPALAPVEVEKQITYPLETAMAGIPGVEEIRSLSKFGLGQVTVVFHDDVDIYFARQQVQERLLQAQEAIPPDLAKPEMGPISTGLGEIFQYALEADGKDLTELRTLHDWTIKPQLLSVPGVAEVNSFGGFQKQYEVRVRPEALRKYDLTLREVMEAVAAGNENRGGGYITHGSEQYVIRGVGQVRTPEQIGAMTVASRRGVPIRVSDLAEVAVGKAIRQGAVTKDGKGEVMAGVVMMLMGSNSRQVVADVKERIAAISKTLPAGVRIKPFYDRSELIDRTIATVRRNLIEGACLVVLVLFLLLGNLRGAILVAFAIPMSMLFAVTLMGKAGIAGSLMSLGALDFGLLVDGSVVMVENALRRLAARKEGESPEQTLLSACVEVAQPVFFGIGIIIIVYLPILTLQGVEGKLFRPMALTVVFALLGSLLFAFCFIPVLASLFLKHRAKQKESRALAWAHARYAPALAYCLAHRRRVLAGAGIAVALAATAFPFLGSEFVPKLDEGAFALEMRRPSGISLEAANEYNTRIQARLLEKFPDEIQSVVAMTGRAEIATDPMGPNSTDLFIFLKPRKQWRAAEDREGLVAGIEKELDTFLGVTYEFSQPIEMRMNELIAGVRSDVAIKIFGEDMDVLQAKAAEVAAKVSRIPGAKGFRAQQVSGLPMLEIAVDPDRLARYGITASEVMQVVESLGGIEVTQIQDGARRFPLVATFVPEAKRDKDAIAALPVKAPGGEWVPLGSLCRIEEKTGPSEIDHEKGSRLIIVEGNVRGRDLGGFVAQARKLFETGAVKLPEGYRAEFGGQFENLERARNRLMIVVPLSLALIFLLLLMHFGSTRESLLVFTGIPLAVVGGVAALALRGMPFSISAGVGFIALSGIAVLNGVVMVTYIDRLRRDGLDLQSAIREGAETRLRPVLMTALVASLGFIPMALSHGSGAEVQRPLATVVIGGLVSSTALTLLVLPVLYSLYEGRPGKLKR